MQQIPSKPYWRTFEQAFSCQLSWISFHRHYRQFPLFSFHSLLKRDGFDGCDTKPAITNHPEHLLTCLSVTDLLVGMISQPLHVSIALLLLLGNRSHTFCHLTLVFNASVLILCGASLFHLVLISAERYFTIKHSFANGILITKSRLIISSVVAWIATLILVIVPTVTRITVILILRQIAAISLIVAFKVIVYREVRRHEKQILTLQVKFPWKKG